MNRLLILFAAFCGTAVAQQMPTIVGNIPTQGGGQIVLSSDPCTDRSDRYLGYLQDRNSKVMQMLCWDFVDDQIFVAYADGDVYTYPILAVRFSPQFEQWVNNKGSRT